MYKDAVLECQTCGEVLRELSLAEAQKVAWNPEKYIFDCKYCAKQKLNSRSDYYFN